MLSLVPERAVPAAERSRLAPRFRSLPDDDLVTRSAHLIARRR